MSAIHDETLKPKLYPIQATYIGVRELYIKTNRPPSPTVGLEGKDYQVSTGHTEYDQQAHTIQVAAGVEIGDENEGTSYPFHIKVGLYGEFRVNEELFPVERIAEWAKVNAFFILYPYIREQVYALSARCGFSPVLLPLLEIPTIRLGKAETEPADQTAR